METILGTKFYKLEDAYKAGIKRTKDGGTLYVYSQPCVNGLFVDWILSGLKYNNIKPTYIITNGKLEN